MHFGIVFSGAHAWAAASLAAGAARGQSLAELIDRELPSIGDIYRTIHAAPELSHYEAKTAALVARELKAAGCEVFTGLGKFTRDEWKGHGVAGVLRNGSGPVVLLRAELDALPITEQTGLPYASKVRATTNRGVETGVMHACGHDLHVAAMLGTARLLAAQKGRWRGTVVFVGQPAEETLDCVKALLADGLFQKVPRPDYCLALHCAPDLATVVLVLMLLDARAVESALKPVAAVGGCLCGTDTTVTATPLWLP